MKIEPRRLAASVAACALVFGGATVAVDRMLAVTPDPVAAAPAPPGSANLSIASFVFDPNPLVVAPGTTVTVTNRDNAKHTVTSGARDNPDGTFDLTVDGSGTGSFVVPAESGDYPYICTIHPGMKATIEVTP